MSLLKKLLEIQKAVDHFTKDKKGHNYEYTTGDQVLNKIRPMMNEHGLLLKQEVVHVQNEKIEYETKYGQKAEMFTSAKQKFTWIDTESEEELPVDWHANGMNDWDKGLGSSLTYAERYFLLKFFHVPTDEDDPDTNQQGRTKQPKKDNREWLNKTHKDSEDITKKWQNATKAIRTGKYTADQIIANYQMRNELKKELKSIQNAVTANGQ